MIAGHTGDADEKGAYGGLLYLPCNAANGHSCRRKESRPDLSLLPEQPDRSRRHPRPARSLGEIRANKAIVLFDAAYGPPTTDPALPHSIFEIAARECAIEFRSFSKNGGFTGVRCAFTIVPKTVTAQTRSESAAPLAAAANDHQVQRSLLHHPHRGVYTVEGKRQVRALVDHYMDAAVLREGVRRAGLKVFGGVNAPLHLGQSPGQYLQLGCLR